MMRLGLGGGEERVPVVDAVKASHEVVVDLGNFTIGIDFRKRSAVQQEEEPDCQQQFMFFKGVSRTEGSAGVPRSDVRNEGLSLREVPLHARGLRRTQSCEVAVLLTQSSETCSSERAQRPSVRLDRGCRHSRRGSKRQPIIIRPLGGGFGVHRSI